VDESDQVGLDNKPFWYAGALNVFHMGPNVTRMDLHDPAAVEPAKNRVSNIAGRLRGVGGGLISIYYHPCEWVHREFWDGVNFSRGANPPREQWKAPPQRTADETEGAFKRFEGYIDHIRSIPGVRWIAASDLPVLYPDTLRSEGASKDDIDELARRIVHKSADGLDFQIIGSRAYSVADQFELLIVAVNESISGRSEHFTLKISGLFGPDAAPSPSSDRTGLNWFAFRGAARDGQRFIQTEGRVPARIFAGTDPIAPGDFLVALASVWINFRADGKLPTAQNVPLGRNVPLLTDRHVAKDTPELFGGWVIHKDGFRAPKLMELARLQSWTLKPAIPKSK
jgi:hypothetical protein